MPCYKLGFHFAHFASTTMVSIRCRRKGAGGGVGWNLSTWSARVRVCACTHTFMHVQVHIVKLLHALLGMHLLLKGLEQACCRCSGTHL